MKDARLQHRINGIRLGIRKQLNALVMIASSYANVSAVEDHVALGDMDDCINEIEALVERIEELKSEVRLHSIAAALTAEKEFQESA